ncbi:hypothetical protein V12G01_18677 [Vibrio alginolyticus 12G01]|nr:hypothetical protein V12G01_18677 [Vibrio alginolyticus 12G01]
MQFEMSVNVVIAHEQEEKLD